MRKALIAVGVLIVLIVVAIAALPFAVDANRYRGKVQSELQARTGRPVSLGQMRLSVFPFAFRVENAIIGEDKNFASSQPFAQVGELFVSAKLIPLMRGDVQIDSLELRRPRIELIRNRQGVWNFSTMNSTKPQNPPATTPQPQPEPQTQPGSQGRKLSLAELKIIDGQVALTDQQRNQPRAIYDHIDLQLNDYAPDKKFSFELAAHLPGAGAQRLSLDGEAGPMRSDTPSATDFKGSLKLDEVSLSGLKKFLNSQALENIEFVASGKAEVENKAGLVTSSGDLKLEKGRVNGVEIGYPVTADYNVTADLNSELYKIGRGTLKLGATPVSVVGTINGSPTPMVLDLKVDASNASISEAARLAAAFGIAFNPGMDIKGKIDAALTAKGAANKPVMNGKVSTHELVITGKGLPQAVQVTNVDLALTPTTISSNEFVATTGSTATHVNFVLNSYASDNSSIDATVRADGAKLGELLSIAKASGISAVEDMDGSGAVNLNVRVQGSTRKNAALNYSGSGTLRDGSISLPSFTKPVQVRQADIKFSQNAAIFDNVVFALGSTNARGSMSLKGLNPGATPQLQFALNADKFDATEWQTLMRNQPVPAKTAAIFELIPTAYAARVAEAPLMHRLVGNGTVDVANLIYDKLQMTNAHSNVNLDHGVVKLAPFTAQLYGGAVNGTMVMDTRPTPAVYTVSTKMDRVDANQLLSAVSKADKILYGLLAANANTNFTGTTSDNIASHLNGNIQLNLQDGKMANLDLLNQLAAIGKFGAQGTTQPYTNIVKLTGNFDVKNGVARTDNLNAVIDAGSLAAKGAIDLANQTLDMQVTAVLSQPFSQSVGGNNIGGYLTTALANSKGELVMPVIITGTFTNPKVAPDVRRLAQMKLDNLLPSMGSPGSLTTSILGGLLGTRKKEDMPQSDQGATPGDPNNTTPANVGDPNQKTPQKTAEPAPPQSVFDQIMGAVGAAQKKKQEPAKKEPEKPQEPPK
ncbi:MAG TPA: AsmA family protein [Terriglobales bacterium]|nr:AsmA family protein [Terriglobales bacterium]